MQNQNHQASLESFIKLVQAKCEENNVQFFLSKEPNLIISGLPCAGYFDEKIPKLAVATGKPFEEWIEILVHEYCHLNQFVENTDIWNDRNIDDVDSSAVLDLWLNHRVEMNPDQLLSCVLKIIDVEKDCEQRVVKLISELNLPIDPVLYAKKSNAYVLGYHAVKNQRRWFKAGKGPYSNKEVVQAMPDHFNLDYLSPDESLIKIIEDHCFGQS